MNNTPTPAQALGEVMSRYQVMRQWPSVDNRKAFEWASVNLWTLHGQYFAGLEAEVEQWKRNTLTFKERGDRLAFDVHSLERKLEAAEARCAELEKRLADTAAKSEKRRIKLIRQQRKRRDLHARAREAEGLLRDFDRLLSVQAPLDIKRDRIAAFLAASGGKNET